MSARVPWRVRLYGALYRFFRARRIAAERRARARRIPAPDGATAARPLRADNREDSRNGD